MLIWVISESLCGTEREREICDPAFKNCEAIKNLQLIAVILSCK